MEELPTSSALLALEERKVAVNKRSTRTTNVSLEVIRSLGAEALRQVYGGSVWTVRAIYQMLGGVEQQYIIRLMCTGSDGVRNEIISQWTYRPERHVQAMATLCDLGIVHEDREKVRLDASFLASFRHVLAGEEAEPWKDIVLKATAHKPTIEQLREWMVWRWNNVLFYIVGDALDERSMPPEQVVELLRLAGLMAPVQKRKRRNQEEDAVALRDKRRKKTVKLVVKGPRPADEEVGAQAPGDDDDDDQEEQIEITGSGLEFLLSVRQGQVWRLVHSLLQTSERETKAQLIALVLSFAHCVEGEAYPVEALSPVQKDALKIFFGLGLLFLKSTKATRFYPTQLGIEVALGPAYLYSAGKSIIKEHNLITTATADQPLDVIVQTNFQVFAYTNAQASSSRLVVAILSLFASLKMRLPNLVVGEINRTAIRTCVQRGIRIRQIQSFLEGHAHPLVRQRKDISKFIPNNVLDQIYIWGSEDDRASFLPGTYLQLPSLSLFDAALAFATKKSALLYRDPDSRSLVFRPEIENDLRSLLIGLGAQLPPPSST